MIIIINNNDPNKQLQHLLYAGTAVPKPYITDGQQIKYAKKVFSNPPSFIALFKKDTTWPKGL